MKNYIRFIVLSAFVAGCASNKEEATADVCSTANVSYTGTIAPLINSSGCLGCHAGSAPEGGFALQNYDQVKAKAQQTRNGNAVLYGAVAHLNGFTPMPKGMAQLSSCDIAKIKAWIDAGTPQ